jgi:hypothetical protein
MLRLRMIAGDGAAPAVVEIVPEFRDPHLELLRLLREAAEIEHALMVHYLYAAFSVRDVYRAKLAGTGFAGSARTRLAATTTGMRSSAPRCWSEPTTIAGSGSTAWSVLPGGTDRSQASQRRHGQPAPARIAVAGVAYYVAPDERGRARQRVRLHALPVTGARRPGRLTASALTSRLPSSRPPQVPAR